ncbi:MAG TPA: hypothetical protein PLJ21_01135 [Pseudobdellovibrionaceae bacterium]|nr:hypothetical protein [Pseudobdellovibrionaceae bacterium]
MSIFLSFILAASTAATPNFELKVESPKLDYSVSIQGKKFIYQSGSKKVQQQIQPCAARAYELFIKKIENSIKNDFSKVKVKTPKAIQVTINKENFYLSPLSSSGVLISKIETDVAYLISEDVYRCSKK